MKHLALLTGLLVAFGANAGGFTDEPTCYSWNGGHKSAGSFSKCQPELQAWVKPAPPAPPPVAYSAPVTAPVVVHQSPIMMPQSHPIPLKPKHKPKPKYHHPKKGC
jgi:hypothetical protein